MKNIIIFLFCVVIVSIALILKKSTQNHSPETLLEVKKSIINVSKIIDDDLSKAAKQLSITGIDNNEAREILSELAKNNKYAVDVCTVSPEGIIKIIEPATFKDFEGDYIKNQEQIIRLHKNKKAVVSKAFRSVEGFLAIDFEYPIFSKNGEFMGSVSILTRPKNFLDKIILPLIKGLPVDIWLMQDDGLIIYDQDVEEIGKNIFTNKIYMPFAGLQKFSKNTLKNKNGSGNYSFYSGKIGDKVSKKLGYWTTIDIGGIKWKIILTKSQNLKISAKRTLNNLNLKSVNNSFNELSTNDVFLSAVALNDTVKILKLFENFYNKYSEIYSIQYIDTNIINRFGFPLENCFLNYKYNFNKNHDKNFIKAFNKRKKSKFVLDLLEGGKGNFYLNPIFYKNKYYGLIYYISFK